MFILVSSSLLLTFISGDDVTCTAENVEVPVVVDAVIFILVSSFLIFSLVIDGVTVSVTTDVPVLGNAVIFMEQISLIQKQGSDLNLQALSNGYQASM